MKIIRLYWRRAALVCIALTWMLGIWRPAEGENLGLPRCLVYLPPHRTLYAVLVEKASATLFLYKSDDQGLQLVDQYPCSLGKAEGDKRFDGDQRTPSGIFWLEAQIPEERLPLEYGAGALVLNYPNFFHRLEGQRGDGIWIHGTHLPGRTRIARDTDGCIVITDEAFQQIRGMTNLLDSPVIVQKRIRYLEPDEWRQQQRDFLNNLQRWLRTWENGYYQEPDSLYSKRFATDPLGADHLLRLRRTMTQNLTRNQVWVRNLVILRNGTTALSTFTQEWWTDHGVSRWVKAVYWALEQSDWRIVGEELLERPVSSSES